MFFLRSRLAHFTLILSFAAMLADSSCTRASGPAFGAALASDTRESGIYLYRRSALAAYGQQFTVLVDGRPAGHLANASYLRLRLTAGSHLLQIAPGGVARSSTAQLHVVAGAPAFYEFVFPTGWAMRPSFDGAAIEARPEAQAMAGLRGLRQM
jgi:hypothetical protein